MAKGNMLQGMARGKVGDIVFSRLNGEQISRVRNRNPKNPRTNAQLYQRAIMATVMQAYSAGMVIFNHSFQGKSVGAANQRRFMSLNAKRLRDQIAADLQESSIENQKARVVAPGAITPVPNAFIVSEGSYEQKLFTTGMLGSELVWQIPAKETNETIAHYAERVGLIAGDIYTYVAFGLNDETVVFEPANITSDYAKQKECTFAYLRFIVKDNLSANNATLNAITDLFDLESNGDNMEPDHLSFQIRAYNVISHAFHAYSTVIRSRKDVDLRSTSIMIEEVTQNNASYHWGIAPDYLLDIWKTGSVSLGDSDLILEGGGGTSANSNNNNDDDYSGD